MVPGAHTTLAGTEETCPDNSQLETRNSKLFKATIRKSHP